MGKRLDPKCRAFQTAIELLARPWTGLILGLLSAGSLRFSEIEERAAGVGAKTLSARLKDLETRRLIVRSVDGGPPVRVQYTLTGKGRAFGRVAEAIQRWGHDLVTDEPESDRGTRTRRAETSQGVRGAPALARKGRRFRGAVRR